MSIHSFRIISRRRAAVALLTMTLVTSASAQRPVEVARTAPRDKPVSAQQECHWRALQRAIAPLVSQAKSTYPAARRRFLAGLPPKESFFVTTVITDSSGRHEQIFVVVDSIAGDRILGRIWSQIELVNGYRFGQRYTFGEADLIDWMFSKPDGSEDGNVVGKFMDTYQPAVTCDDTTHR